MSRPRRLFLVDGLGALLTTGCLAVIMFCISGSWGMPRNIVLLLLLPAGCFALYSTGCWLLNPGYWQPWLKAIALANLAYCCTTLALVWFYRNNLTTMGHLYFLLEAAIMIVLVYIEWKVAGGSR